MGDVTQRTDEQARIGYHTVAERRTRIARWINAAVIPMGRMECLVRSGNRPVAIVIVARHGPQPVALTDTQAAVNIEELGSEDSTEGSVDKQLRMTVNTILTRSPDRKVMITGCRVAGIRINNWPVYFCRTWYRRT